ncbi:hypothetical protein [Desulfofalx alkaliphila]|uniref:hypothetical protein n=1 Tax=Desulfofalx alkaliphila TaxID=105483 RepID=UPI0005519E74|nr:hypothetical protein [Desulfofalx alkaliphila]
MEQRNVKNTLEYIHSELNKIQTIAGTISTVETEHSKDLMDYGDDKLNQIASEEQSAARQLGQVQQICISLAQEINNLKKSLN